MIEVEKNYFEYSGTTCYFIKGTNIRHREDGTALEYEDGHKVWYYNRELHREDGPAVTQMEFYSGIGMENFTGRMVQR